MKLYYSRNPNPRLAVAVARYLGEKVAFEPASPFAPGQAERFRKLNPNLSLPILVESGRSLWEADAIACRLSRVADADFWRTGDDEPDMIRWLSWGKENFVRACDMVHFERGTKQRYWLSWGKENFVRACDMVHFERGTKQRYGLGAIDQDQVEEGLKNFASSATLLEVELSSREWLVGSMPTFEWRPFYPSMTSPNCRLLIIRRSIAGIGAWKKSMLGAIRSKDWMRLRCRPFPVKPATSVGGPQIAEVNEEAALRLFQAATAAS